MKCWDSLDHLFSYLNGTNAEYLVLRNWELLNGSSSVASKHLDIDFLCRDRESFITHIGSISNANNTDQIHQRIKVGDHFLRVDLRTINDGYYDKTWEEDMLKNRILFDEKINVMDKKNYFYSLLYHAHIQKKTLADDYRIKLTSLAHELDIDYNEGNWADLLNSFMYANHYSYTFPEYKGAYVDFSQVDKRLIKHSYYRELRRKIYSFKRKLIRSIKK